MSIFKRLTHIIKLHGITFVLTFCIVTALIVLSIAGFFIPSIYDYIAEKRLSDIVIMACLLEIILLLIKEDESTETRVFTDEITQQSDLIQLVDKVPVSSIDIISAGLSARAGLIQQLLHKGCAVRLLAQHPKGAVDKNDAKRVRDQINVIGHLKEKTFIQNLRVRYSLNPVTLRAVILHGKSLGHSYALLSWYTYHKGGSLIKGRGNTSILVSSASPEGRELISFAQNVFNLTWDSNDESKDSLK